MLVMITRHISVVLFLLALSLSASGCLNGVITLIIHPDGSATYIEDLVLDKMLLDITAASKDTSSALLLGGKKRTVVWDKAHADAVKSILFAEQIKSRSSKPYVKSVVAIDTPTYSGLHFVVTTELTSYRYIDSIAHGTTDSAAAGSKKKSKSKSKSKSRRGATAHGSKNQPLISELGDSIKISVPSSIPKLDELMQNLPDRRAPMFNKLNFPIRRRSFITETSYHPFGTRSGGDEDSTSGSGNMMDSLGKMMGMFTGMMSDMFSLDYNIQVPQMLSHDSSVEIDSATNTLHWHIDLSTMFTGGSSSSEERYVWFRKPRQ